jgi:lysophospholipase L1-like esterase
MTNTSVTRAKKYLLSGCLVPATIALSLLVSACAQSVSGSPAPELGGANTVGASASLISRNAPVFASSAAYPAPQANDGSYDTTWRSSGAPAWLVYDLSHVPAAMRGKVLIVWYNSTFNYDHTVINDFAYDMPEDYTLEANPAPDGGSPPEHGWVTLATVKNNHYHSRQQVIDMRGDNWLRMNITAIDGSAGNEDANINVDVYSASAGTADDWIFYGDSITAGSMGTNTLNGVPLFAQLIHEKAPAYFPVEEDGGIGYLTSSDGLKYLKNWLQLFPGKYVGLSYGTNDADGCVDPQTFYNNYVGMTRIVLADGKIPVIPHIPWGRAPNIQQCGPALNAKIDALYKAFPQIIKGPDLWTFFQQHQALISNDNVHPNDDGAGQYRVQWANAMLKEVYKVTS